jgi:hypothetical protein
MGGWWIVPGAGQAIITTTGSTTTLPIAGSQYAAVELQYIGNNTFLELNYAGTVSPLSITAGYVYEGNLLWMPIGNTSYTWSQGNAYCATTMINGVAGWRLPSASELSALYISGAFANQGWTLDWTLSSTFIAYENVGAPFGYLNVYHALNLSNGAGVGVGWPDGSGWPAKLTCVI